MVLVQTRGSLWQRNRWVKWVAVGTLSVIGVTVTVVDIALHKVEPYLRTRIVEDLENHFHARVELDDFHVSLANGLWAEGKGLRVWPPAQVKGVTVPAGQGEPLIQLAEFRFHTPISMKPGKPIHVSVVELSGLSVHLPPKSHFAHGTTDSSEAGDKPRGTLKKLVSFEVDKLECADAELAMETDKPGKMPLMFSIARLNLTGIASGGSLGFEAELTIPKPQGTVYATGKFGPWQTADPGSSLIAGDYQIDHADLSVFNGIAGILSSSGHFEGTLRDLVVDGQTQTPDFRLTHFGTPLSLSTRFHAQVDGTNGDTWLEPVDAVLGRSHFTVKGKIVRAPGEMVDGAQQYKGHDIALAVNVDRARIEDFLQLASHTGKVLLTGDMTMQSTLNIPPGAASVEERMKLNGQITLDKAKFTSVKIQSRIAELSLRGQGRPDEIKTTDPASILSQMRGDFQLTNGEVTLPALDYEVTGAKIQLQGTYALENGGLNFTGTAKMEASMSRMVGGWKGMLLSPADRYFERDGAGTEVPIHIEGTRDEPKIGIDFERRREDSGKKR